MAKLFGSQVDFQRIPLLNVVIHSSASEPATPVNGMLWFDTSLGVMKVREAGTWLLVANAASGSTPTGPAGGDLSGSYPNPTIGTGKVTSTHILDATITDTDVAAANKDGAVATASMRTLGTGAQQAFPGTGRLDQVAAPTSDVSLNNRKITNLGDPVADSDAANKLYVDFIAQGLDAKVSVRAATTANITLSGTQTVDGIALTATMRCLVKNQSAPAQNGIYDVAAGAWTRSADMNAWTEVPSAFVFVEQGTVNGDTGWVSTADVGGTLNTTAITWTQFSSAGNYTGGAGLVLTGTTFDVGGTTNRITVGADAVDIASNYVGQASITTLGTITTGTWTGTDIAVADGGTGASTAAAARTNLAVPGKFSGVLGALTAGVAANVVHNLNTLYLVAQFFNDSTLQQVEFDVKGVDANTIAITPDVNYSASAIRAVVIG